MTPAFNSIVHFDLPKANPDHRSHGKRMTIHGIEESELVTHFNGYLMSRSNPATLFSHPFSPEEHQGIRASMLTGLALLMAPIIS